MPAINPSIKKIIDLILAREGGYVNNSTDKGGETNYGITIATARRNGYAGAMRDLPRDKAVDIYYREYVVNPGFDRIIEISESIAAEVIDTGVNIGCPKSAKLLQRVISAVGDNHIEADGMIGPSTLYALRAIVSRGQLREAALLKALNCLQGAYYIEITEANPSQKAFIVGWLNNRVTI